MSEEVIIPPDSAPDAIDNIIADIASGSSNVDKIKLSADTETYGVGVPENTKLTLELNGHELEPIPDENGQYAGSTGTKTLGMQLLKGSTIVIKDGKITGNGGNPPTKMVIQNYCNLTLDNTIVEDAGKDTYVLSNNFGEVHLKNGTQLLAKSNHVAFDLWYGMAPDGSYDDGVTVYIDTPDVVIQGPIEYGHAKRISNEQQFLDHTHLYVCKDYDISQLNVVNSTSGSTVEYEFVLNEEIGYYELLPKA